MHIIVTIAAVFGVCFCLFNYWFQKEKYNRLLKNEIKKLNVMNSPKAWLIYTLVFVALLFGIIGYYVLNLMDGILKIKVNQV